MSKRRLDGTQGEWVKRQLLAGKPITHADLIQVCGGRGGHRLAAHIWNLRHQDNWPVASTVLPGAGGPNPMVCYTVPTGWRPGAFVQLELSV